MRPFEDLSRTEIEYLITEWVHNQRDRQIMRRRLLDGVVFERIAGEFDLSVPQIKTIVYKSQNKMIEHI